MSDGLRRLHTLTQQDAHTHTPSISFYHICTYTRYNHAPLRSLYLSLFVSTARLCLPRVNVCATHGSCALLPMCLWMLQQPQIAIRWNCNAQYFITANALTQLLYVDNSIPIVLNSIFYDVDTCTFERSATLWHTGRIKHWINAVCLNRKTHRDPLYTCQMRSQYWKTLYAGKSCLVTADCINRKRRTPTL